MELANNPKLLGIAQACVQRPHATDIIGISPMTMLPICPYTPTSHRLILAVNREVAKSIRKFSCRLIEIGKPQRFASLAGEISANARAMVIDPVTGNKTEVDEEVDYRSNTLVMPDNDYRIIALPCPPLAILEPCDVEVWWTSGSQSELLGEITFAWVPQLPLDDDERQALLADPNAGKVVVLRVGCNKCNSERVVFETLEKNKMPANLPPHASRISSENEVWICSCKKTVVPLKYIYGSWPLFFRHPAMLSREPSSVMTVPVFHNRIITDLLTSFRQLLARETKEEAFQLFIEEHPILWSFLAPSRVRHKCPILSKYKTDFAVLTSHGVLVLIEIEKPNTPIRKANKGRHHSVQLAFDQVSKWRAEIERHRAAVIEGIGFKPDQIAQIRYLIVAGRDSDGAQYIRSDCPPDVSFLTYDELASHLVVLQTQLVAR